MEFTFSNLLVNILLSICGMVFYGIYSVRNHLLDFDLKIFIGRNKVFWIWAGIAQFMYSILMAFFPALEIIVAERLISTINALIGLDANIPSELITTVVYLSGTWLLSRLANGSVKPDNKIGKAKETINPQNHDK